MASLSIFLKIPEIETAARCTSGVDTFTIRARWTTPSGAEAWLDIKASELSFHLRDLLRDHACVHRDMRGELHLVRERREPMVPFSPQRTYLLDLGLQPFYKATHEIASQAHRAIVASVDPGSQPDDSPKSTS